MLLQLDAVMREAGELMLSTHDAKVFVKPGEANFVTECDIRVQELVKERLYKLCPEAAFVGEESKENDYSAGLRWIVDPIDGTTNFMHGYRRSCVSIALVDGNKPLYAGVRDPYMDESFLAEAGKGAFCNGARLRASEFPQERAIISFGTTPYDRSAADKSFEVVKALYMNTADIRRSGSAAIDLCYVAAGRTDGFFELTLQPWDIAAGALMISEAGGVMTDFSGEKHTFKCGESVIAASKTIYPVIFDIIKEKLS